MHAHIALSCEPFLFLRRKLGMRLLNSARIMVWSFSRQVLTVKTSDSETWGWLWEPWTSICSPTLFGLVVRSVYILKRPSRFSPFVCYPISASYDGSAWNYVTGESNTFLGDLICSMTTDSADQALAMNGAEEANACLSKYAKTTQRSSLCEST